MSREGSNEVYIFYEISIVIIGCATCFVNNLLVTRIQLGGPLFMPPKELWEAYSNCTVRPSRFVSGAYLLYSSRWNSKFGAWMHLGMAECRVPFSGHCDLDL